MYEDCIQLVSHSLSLEWICARVAIIASTSFEKTVLTHKEMKKTDG